jgi:type IV pilus assembly protein PilA
MKLHKGFTLIELLIVITVIGILSTALIPQLIGARTAAHRKAVQSHSANVFKSVNAIYSDDGTLDRALIAQEAQVQCLNQINEIIISNISYQYGWSKPPDVATECTVVPNAGSGFIVTVTGNASIGNQKSVNGSTPD